MRCNTASSTVCPILLLLGLIAKASASARFFPGPSVLVSGKVEICHHHFHANTFSLVSVSVADWQVNGIYTHDRLQHADDCCVKTRDSSWAAGGCNSKSCERSHVITNPALGTCQCMQGYTFNPTTHRCEGPSATHARAIALPGRALQQTTSPACPAGCAEGKCDGGSTGGGFRCSACKDGMELDTDTGTCHCHAGKYANAPTAAALCVDCDKGYYCTGGKYTGEQDASGKWLPARTACPETLTTHGKRSSKVIQCVNPPGTKYVPNNDPLLAMAEECPPDTYGPGYYKQRGCVNCPPGYVNPRTGQSFLMACGVPAGYYLVDPAQVAPCPKGQYKEGVGEAHSCQKCPDHVTTETVGSTNAGDCKVLLRGVYGAEVSADGVITGVAKCPYNHYCPGGKPSSTFDPASPIYDTTVVKCPRGSWTQHDGAFADAECMIPPGFALPDGADTPVQCGVEGSGPTASGTYMAEWKPLSAATSCVRCGDGISATGLDQVTSYDLLGAATQYDVATSAAACYIRPAQGMYYNLAADSFWAGNCDNNNYGGSSITYGLAAHPCRSCPAGMQTDTDNSNSRAHWSADGPGFTGPLACVTKPGHGYNGRSAPQCAVGSWNTGGNYDPCTLCDYGLSTADDPAMQAYAYACTTKIGFGYHDGAVVPCPLGTYNDQLGASAYSACKMCPDHLTTALPGGDSVGDCNMCAVGFGGQGCNTECGGSGSNATYGPAGRARDTNCTTCPDMSRGFFFDYQSSGHPYIPDVISRPGAVTESDCLAEFAQLVDNAWFLGNISDPTSMTEVTGLSGASVDEVFEACVTHCKPVAHDCQFVTFDYATSKCFKKLTYLATTNDWLAYKALLAGGPGIKGLSLNTTAKGLASGSFTYYQETLGCPDDADTCNVNCMALTKVVAATTVQACVNTCVWDGACAAVSMLGVQGHWTSPTATVSSCYLVKGDSSAGAAKRSVTKTVLTLMSTDTVKVGPVMGGPQHGTPITALYIPFDFKCPQGSFVNKYKSRYTEGWPIAFGPVACSDGVTATAQAWVTGILAWGGLGSVFELPATGTLATGCPGFEVGADYDGVSGLDFSVCGGNTFGQMRRGTQQLHCPPTMQVVGVFGTYHPGLGLMDIGVYCRP